MKWRLFSDFTNKDVQNVYLWHIAHRRSSGYVDSNKNNLDVFVPAARQLLASMSTDGFDRAHPVPVDDNGDILGGAHRVACALALGEDAWCEPSERLAWAPAWDAAWFRQHGMPESEVEGLLADYQRLTAGSNTPSLAEKRRG